MKKQTLAWLLALMLLAATIVPASATNAWMQQVEPLINNLLQSEITRAGASDLQGWVNGSLAAKAGQGSEWIVLALAQLQDTSGLPVCDLSAYQRSLTVFLSQGTTYGASTRQKYALCMMAAGGDATVAETAETTIGQQGIMSWVYGLHLLNNGCQSSLCSPAEAAAQLISQQLPDGGWALMGQNADVDVTAMTLQALAPHREEPAVATAVEKAVALLANRQLPDGGFMSMGQPNPESAAQVMIALCALGIDPLDDERFQKNGATLLDGMIAYRLPDGGYAHTQGGEYSTAATAQVLNGLAAYARFAAGLPGLYLLDAPRSNAGTPLKSDQLPTGHATASIGIIGGADGPTAIYVAGGLHWKPIAVTVILALAALWCLRLLIRRKGRLKNYLAVALLTAVLLGFVLTLDIQLPGQYYGTPAAPEGEIIGTVTMDIRCDALAKAAQGAYIPEDGIILPETPFFLCEGDSVYDLLTQAARQYQLQLDISGSEGMRYVSGLHHLYEQAYGELSGWMYFVNGASASQSCDQYLLSDGDHIRW